MAFVPWSDFNNGDTLLTIRQKLNSYNTEVGNELFRLDSDVATLSALNIYEFNKVKGVSTTDENYQPLNELVVPSAPVGTYHLQFNALFSYSSTGRSAYFRASDDGGTTWTEIRKEAKDVSDTNGFDYSYPYSHTGGDIHLKIEYRTERNGDILNVHGTNLVVERKT